MLTITSFPSRDTWALKGISSIGASISKQDQDRIQAALEADPVVERVSDLKTEILGQGRIRVKCEVDLYEKLMAHRICAVWSIFMTERTIFISV